MAVQEGLENSPAVNAAHMSLHTQRDSIPQSNADMHECILFLCPADCRGFSRAQTGLCVQRNPKFRASQWKFFVFS